MGRFSLVLLAAAVQLAASIKGYQPKPSVLSSDEQMPAVIVRNRITMQSYFKPAGCATADKANVGAFVGIHYIGKVKDSGAVFHQTTGTDSPLELLLGQGSTIKGLEQGVEGMCVGEKRKIAVPPSLGFGSKGNAGVPGAANLLFDVELKFIRSDTFGAPKRQRTHVEEDYVFFNLCDTNKDGKIDEAEMTKYWRQLGMTQQKWADYLLDGSKDTNGDSMLTFEEFHTPESIFVHDDL